MALNYDDFRDDIGDENGAYADEDIDRLEARAIARWGAAVAFEGARLLAVQQLLANAAKFNDYVANDSQEKKSQKFNNLLKLRDMYKGDLREAQEDAAGSSMRFGRNSPPPRRKEWPDA
jgi:hypothetical protein